MDVPLDLPPRGYSGYEDAEHDERESHAGEDAARVSVRSEQ